MSIFWRFAIAVVCSTSLCSAATYEEQLYELGAFPVSKLTKPYWDNGDHGKVYSKGTRLDVDGWLPPNWTSSYLTEAEKIQYGLPKKPLTYDRYQAMLDVDAYRRTHAPMQLLVMRFAIQSMNDNHVQARKEDILRVYEAGIGLEKFAVPLLKGQLSATDAMRLVRTYNDEQLFEVLPQPAPAESAYVDFLVAQTQEARWNARRQQEAFKLLLAMDGTRYREPYRQFLISRLKTCDKDEQWWIRCGLFLGLIELNDEPGYAALRDGLLNEPSTETRQNVLFELQQHGVLSPVIETILAAANGQGVKPRVVSPAPSGPGGDAWLISLRDYLNWARSQNGISRETLKEIDQAIARIKDQ